MNNFSRTEQMFLPNIFDENSIDNDILLVIVNAAILLKVVC
jgi:hypothetical protein